MKPSASTSLAIPEQPVPPDVRRLRWPLRHPVTLYLLRLSVGGRPTQVSALRAIASFLGYDGADGPVRLPWAELGPEHLAALRAHLAANSAPNTANRYLTALRGVLHACVRLGMLAQQRVALLLEELLRVKGDRPCPGRMVPEGELARLLQAAGTSPKGKRDRAAVALLFGCGLRRVEAVSLNLDDVCETEVGPSVTVQKGKGNKSRVVPVPETVWPFLVAWREERGEEPGPFLTPVYTSKYATTIAIERLGCNGLHRALVKLQREAGVRKLTSHDFRRTWISTMLATSDVVTVQQLAGHASCATTASYDRRPEQARRLAVAAIRLPSV
jgi:integrase/recombinase XerD